MRLRLRQDRRINAGIRSGDRGSIVVEAAIVMPLIMLLLLVFIIFLRLCVVQMALNSTASQAVKEAAAHIHPVYLAWLETRQDETGMSELDPHSDAEASQSQSHQERAEWRDIAAVAANWLPEPVGTLVTSVMSGDWRPLQNMAATEIGRVVIEPYIRQFASNGAALDPDRIRLQWLTLPDLKDRSQAYLAVAVEYEFPLRWPFGGKPIIVQAQAMERVWVSDSLAADYGSYSDDESNVPLQIIAIEPSPLRPGRQATVIVKTAPQAAVSLEVDYKSGKSKAKHLGEATADASGYVRWTWHVSGNTTPGIWQLSVSLQSGASGTISKHFAVEKKP